MKKIVIATDGFLPRWDGIVRFLLEIVPKLEEHYEVRILAPKFEGDYYNPFNCEVIRFDLLKIKFGDIFFAKPASQKKYIEDADLVFVQSLGSIGMSAIRAAHKLNKPIAVYTHLLEWDLAVKSIKRFKKISKHLAIRFTRKFYNKCDLLMCPTEEVALKYDKIKVRTPKKIISLGTDTNIFMPAENKEEAKRSIGIESEKTVIGYHGRLGREKDLITLYRAFRRIESKHKNVKLLIVGEGVKDQEAIFSSQRNIIMPGSKMDVVPYLQAMDIYVLPSLTETTSLCTLEAMSCGLPVISTPVGYVKDYIEERENGMLFPFRNSMRLSMKIELLMKDKELKDRLGKKARETIQEKFNWNNTYREVKETIDGLL